MAKLVNLKKLNDKNLASVRKEYSHAYTTYGEEKPKGKKRKKIAKLVINSLVICSLAIAVVLITVVGTMFSTPSGGDVDINYDLANRHNFVGLALPSDNAGDNITIDESLDDKELAVFLYNTASNKAKSAINMTAYNDGWLVMIMGGSPNLIDIDSVIMKTQDEYFSIIYHLKNSVPILDSFIGAAIAKTTDVVTTERMYADKNSKYLAYQKVKNCDYDDNGVPYANWTSIVDITTQQRPLPVFSEAQNGKFDITKHIMTVDTVTQASVKHVKNGGYYEVKVTYDHLNPDTYVNSLYDIQSGTGDKNALYTQLTAEFTVWENGSFRSFFLNEKWSAKMLIDLEFELQTNWLFSYDISDCNIDTYPDAVATKNAVK